MQLKIYTSYDNKITKIVHHDKSETTIKTVPSCVTDRDLFSNKLINTEINRNKYSIFASSSIGCFMQCKYCYLTIKQCKAGYLNPEQVLSNLKESTIIQIMKYPMTANKYIKLCWMGMGEQHIVDSYSTVNITIKFLHWILKNGYALGVDGVDLSTVLPNIYRQDWIDNFIDLDTRLSINSNPNPNTNYISRSMFRLFYSLNTANQVTRSYLMPNTKPLSQALPLLKYLTNQGISVIFHHILIDKINDSDEEIKALIKLYKDYDLYDHELRILRFNYCDESPYIESENFNNIIKELADNIPKIKIQKSVGSEVKAACGQFIVR